MNPLLINGSPRPNGNTAALIRELRTHLEGEILEISAFYDRIAPWLNSPELPPEFTGFQACGYRKT